jgi:hypothetical protein
MSEGDRVRVDNIYELTGLAHGDHIGVVIHTWLVLKATSEYIEIRSERKFMKLAISSMERVHPMGTNSAKVFCRKERINEMEDKLLSYMRSMVPRN